MSAAWLLTNLMQGTFSGLWARTAGCRRWSPPCCRASLVASLTVVQQRSYSLPWLTGVVPL